MSKVFFYTDRAALVYGDSSELGDVLDPNSVDALVTDPPAGISFMGKSWDDDKGGRDAWITWLARTLAPAFRAMKPGAHGLVWALPRTSHWTALALEMCGFEIRDRVSHLFGTGFPKSITSVSAEIPSGSGTALKPAAEDWWLVRKPLDGSVSDNFARWGTGVLWIDPCRIGYGEDGPPPDRSLGKPRRTDNHIYRVANTVMNPQNPNGRWPAHLVLDEECAAVLDGQSAGASRFFYVAKGARSEKDAGLEHLPVRSGGEATGRNDNTAGLANPRAGAGRTGGARNFHPTVKSIGLMRWLCRLITPLGGTVLDTFAGSGTTGAAALAEGFNFIGCELMPEYLPILEGRIRHALGDSVRMREYT